jgi:hypothetical protein
LRFLHILPYVYQDHKQYNDDKIYKAPHNKENNERKPERLHAEHDNHNNKHPEF